jgi:hypothetical protein
MSEIGEDKRVTWPKEDIDLLKAKWGTMPCAEIGRLFTPVRTKNSIVRKGHTENLPPLESAMEKNGRLAAERKAKGLKPITPVAPKNYKPRKLDDPWHIWTHWEPGDPQLWKHRVQETPEYQQALAAVWAHYAV